MTAQSDEEARRRLHVLLQDRPEGVTDADISFGLGLARAEAHRLLSEEEVAGHVRQEFHAEPQPRTLWFTNTTIRPPGLPPPRRSSPSVLLVSSLVVAAGLVVVAFVTLSQRQPDPRSTYAAAAAPITSEERVEADLAGRQADRWREELGSLLDYLSALEEAAENDDCDAVWAGGSECFTGGRLLSRANFQEERARMQLRVAELQGLLDAASGDGER